MNLLVLVEVTFFCFVAYGVSPRQRCDDIGFESRLPERAGAPNGQVLQFGNSEAHMYLRAGSAIGNVANHYSGHALIFVEGERNDAAYIRGSWRA